MMSIIKFGQIEKPVRKFSSLTGFFQMYFKGESYDNRGSRKKSCYMEEK